VKNVKTTLVDVPAKMKVRLTDNATRALISSNFREKLKNSRKKSRKIWLR
jgi:hypothetical protein